jgi:hypothetical protein
VLVDHFDFLDRSCRAFALVARVCRHAATDAQALNEMTWDFATQRLLVDRPLKLGRGLRRENIVLRRDRHERRNQPIGERLGFILRAIQGQASVPALKGALRDVGKALGLPEDLIKMLSSQVWGWSEAGVRAQCGLPWTSPAS